MRRRASARAVTAPAPTRLLAALRRAADVPRSAERPQDETDLRALLGVLTDDDRRRATAAAGQIERLGANRGKPLRAELEAMLLARG